MDVGKPLLSVRLCYLLLYLAVHYVVGGGVGVIGVGSE